MARSGLVPYARRPVRTPSPFLLAIALASSLAIGCAPRIGDGCQTSTNCSINGDRLCDTSQPGGSCITFDCQPDRCADDAVCVRFNPSPPRLAVVACMRGCSDDGDCREGDGYRCRSVEELAMESPPLQAAVLDLDPPNGRFCVAGE